MFEIDYQPLSSEYPDWGSIAIIPWDTQIFGFAVADYKVGDAKLVAKTPASFQAALATWASAHRAELVSCHIPGDDPMLRVLLPSLGFTFVDYTIQILQAKVQTTEYPAPREPASFAGPSDQGDIERIAVHAFRFGRYHADVRFPRELADQRYREWMHDVMSKLGTENQMYVTRQEGRIVGLCHIEFKGVESHITIMAIEKSRQGAAIGTELGDQIMNDLKQRGIQTVDSRVSAANGAVINLATARGFRVGLPQAIYHWHAPDASHLVPWEKIYTPA